MGVLLSELQGEKRNAVVEYGPSFVFSIVFNPGKIRGNFESELLRLSQLDTVEEEDDDGERQDDGPPQGSLSEYVVETLADLLVSWDITDEDGIMVPINKVTLWRDIPSPCRGAILRTILDNLNVGPEEKKASGGSFSRRDKRGR